MSGNLRDSDAEEQRREVGDAVYVTDMDADGRWWVVVIGGGYSVVEYTPLADLVCLS